MIRSRRGSFLEYLIFPPTPINLAALHQKFRGKTILITGASFGIGEALACLLAPSGAHLILVARTDSKLEEVRQKVQLLGGTAEVFAADLMEESDIRALLAFLEDSGRKVDVFVNNAGKSIRRSVFKSLDRHHDFTRTMTLNYFAPVQLALGLIPKLVEAKGQITNVSSLAVVLLPAPGWAAYLASKSAFDQWMRSVAPELATRKVRCSSIYFPLVRTRMIAPTKSYRNTAALEPEHAARWIAKALLNEGNRYYPWWAWIIVVTGNIIRPVWEFLLPKMLKRKPFS
jgi:short-subunit dehydrogenase